MTDTAVGVKEFGSDPFGGRGHVLSRTATTITWICEIRPGVYQTCVDEFTDPVLEANRDSYNESYGKRFGDGKVVASIPIEKYFRDIVPMKDAGDDAGIKRYLNDSDNQKLRTFRGNI